MLSRAEISRYEVDADPDDDSKESARCVADGCGADVQARANVAGFHVCSKPISKWYAALAFACLKTVCYPGQV